MGVVAGGGRIATGPLAPATTALEAATGLGLALTALLEPAAPIPDEPATPEVGELLLLLPPPPQAERKIDSTMANCSVGWRTR